MVKLFLKFEDYSSNIYKNAFKFGLKAASSVAAETFAETATMEFLLGVRGRDFCLLLTDTTAARSITVMKSDQPKTAAMTSHAVLAFAGESGDTAAFVEFLQRNIRLYSIRNAHDLTPDGIACFVRRHLADSLRSRTPYQANLVLAGVDTQSGEAGLYWIDYLAAKAKVDYAAQGYAQYFVLSLMDRYWREGMSEEEVIKLAEMCVEEMKTRFIGRYTGWHAQIIDAKGIRTVEIAA